MFSYLPSSLSLSLLLANTSMYLSPIHYCLFIRSSLVLFDPFLLVCFHIFTIDMHTLLFAIYPSKTNFPFPLLLSTPLLSSAEGMPFFTAPRMTRWARRSAIVTVVGLGMYGVDHYFFSRVCSRSLYTVYNGMLLPLLSHFL